MKEGFLLWAMLLQSQTCLHLRWEIFQPLTEETSDRIKMQQYIDQNHLSNWKNATPWHYATHKAIQDFCTILCCSRGGHTRRPRGLDSNTVLRAAPAPANIPRPCAREEVLAEHEQLSLSHQPLCTSGPGNLWHPLHGAPAAAAADPAPAPLCNGVS